MKKLIAEIRRNWKLGRYNDVLKLIEQNKSYETSYLLDYMLNGESQDGRKAVLIMETAAKGDAKVTALAFECDLDTKAVECSYLPNGPATLFN